MLAESTAADTMFFVPLGVSEATVQLTNVNANALKYFKINILLCRYFSHETDLV